LHKAIADWLTTCGFELHFDRLHRMTWAKTSFWFVRKKADSLRAHVDMLRTFGINSLSNSSTRSAAVLAIFTLQANQSRGQMEELEGEYRRQLRFLHHGGRTVMFLCRKGIVVVRGRRLL
jgi:hypothetical protein